MGITLPVSGAVVALGPTPHRGYMFCVYMFRRFISVARSPKVYVDQVVEACLSLPGLLVFIFACEQQVTGQLPLALLEEVRAKFKDALPGVKVKLRIFSAGLPDV